MHLYIDAKKENDHQSFTKFIDSSKDVEYFTTHTLLLIILAAYNHIVY